MATLCLGVDPGSTGAIALFSPEDGVLLWTKRMPSYEEILTTGKRVNRVDVKEVVAIFQNAVLTAHKYDYDLIVHIESVAGHPKQSPVGSFNFGYAAAIPHAIAITLDLKVRFVHPAVWKRAVGLQASEKDEARLLARKLFPNFADKLKFKKDVDLADAIFIAAHVF